MGLAEPYYKRDLCHDSLQDVEIFDRAMCLLGSVKVAHGKKRSNRTVEFRILILKLPRC